MTRCLPLIIGAGFGLVGCAPPCHDDGLAQGGCPADTDGTDDSDTQTSPTGDASASATDSADGTASDPTVASASGGGEECPQLQEVLLPSVPTIQVVVDGSGSMNETFDGMATRWESVESTLVGSDGVVTQLQSQIRFGVSLYNNPGMMMCPEVTTLDPQLDAADEITTLLDAGIPAGDTPTGESLVVATQTLVDDTWDGDKVLVLATDGEPDTCAIPDPQGAQVDEVRGVATDAVTAAFDTGIRTFVISVGTDIAEDHLQDLANAGVGNQAGDPDADFWVANDTASLVAAFDAIVAGIRPCTFALSMPLADTLAPTCEVTVNAAAVPYQDTNGWDLPDPSTLELAGDACASIQSGVATVEMTCACEPQ